MMYYREDNSQQIFLVCIFRQKDKMFFNHIPNIFFESLKYYPLKQNQI